MEMYLILLSYNIQVSEQKQHCISLCMYITQKTTTTCWKQQWQATS